MRKAVNSACSFKKSVVTERASQDRGLKTVQAEEKEFEGKRESNTGRQGKRTALEEGLQS